MKDLLQYLQQAYQSQNTTTGSGEAPGQVNSTSNINANM